MPSFGVEQPRHGQSFLVRQRGQNGFSPASQTEPPATGSEHACSMEETTMTQTQERTPQHQTMTMTTSSPSPANSLQIPVTQTCDRSPRAPLGTACSLMCQHVLELEVLCEEPGVCSWTITDSLDLERVVHEQRALAQSLPTALQSASRQRGVRSHSHPRIPKSHQ